MNKGQAILLVLFLVLIIGILSAALSSMWQSEINTRTLGRDSLTAFYMAQSGLEEAKIWARRNPDSGSWPSLPYDSGWVNFTGGRYRFFVEDSGGLNRRIYNRGQKLDSAGNVAAERQISLDVSGIENPFLNPADDQQVSFSWREI